MAVTPERIILDSVIVFECSAKLPPLCAALLVRGSEREGDGTPSLEPALADSCALPVPVVARPELHEPHTDVLSLLDMAKTEGLVAYAKMLVAERYVGSAFGWGRKGLECKVLKRSEGEDLDQAAIFMVPLKVLRNTGCNIARNFPLQQEAVHFRSDFSAVSMQDKALLRDVRIISERPQGKPARHVNTALDQSSLACSASLLHLRTSRPAQPDATNVKSSPNGSSQDLRWSSQGQTGSF